MNTVVAMTDEAIDDMAESVRKPGGLIENPMREAARVAWDAWLAAFNTAPDDVARRALPPPPPRPHMVPEHIPNPGARVPASAVETLKAIAFLGKHKQRTTRGVLDPGTFIRERVDRWKTYVDDYKAKEDPEEAPKLKKTDASSIIDFIDEFKDSLYNYDGIAPPQHMCSAKIHLYQQLTILCLGSQTQSIPLFVMNLLHDVLQPWQIIHTTRRTISGYFIY